MSERRWLYFDLEGTGPDAYVDRIVEVCIVEGVQDLRLEQLNTRVNPGRPIPPETSEIHGIRDEDVADCPRFEQIAAQVQELVQGAVLVGYNIRRYDTVLIDRELRMAGQPGLEREGGKIVQPEVDLYAIWQTAEPRNLASAALRFGGVDLESAHEAAADTRVLPDVLFGMLRQFDLEGTLEQLQELSVPAYTVDRDGKFRRREDGVVLFNIGSSRGQPVHTDPGLLEWMLKKDFSPDTLAYARQFLEEIYGQPDPHDADVGAFFP